MLKGNRDRRVWSGNLKNSILFNFFILFTHYFHINAHKNFAKKMKKKKKKKG